MRRRWMQGIAASAVAVAIAMGGMLGGTTYAAPQAAATEQMAAHRGGNRQAAAAGLIQTAAEVTGLTSQQVAEQLRAGKSLEQIAVENGKTAQDIISAARAKLADRLTQGVTNGKITQSQADAMLQRFDQEAPRVVADTSLGDRLGRGRGGEGRGRGPAVLIQATADVTGLTVEQIRAELAAGKSLAQIAQENGKSVDDILAALRSKGQQRLDQLLDGAREKLSAPGLGQ